MDRGEAKTMQCPLQLLLPREIHLYLISVYSWTFGLFCDFLKAKYRI